MSWLRKSDGSRFGIDSDVHNLVPIITIEMQYTF